MPQTNHAWQNPDRTKAYLSGVRASFPLASEQLDVMLYVLRQFLPDVHHFLDLGCGSGVLSQVIQAQYPHAKGVLLDYSEPMLQFAREAFRADQAVIRHHDLNEPLPVQDFAPFDAIVSGYAIHHLPNERKRSLYGEVFTYLKHGGVFINIEHIASPTARVEELFIQAITDGVIAQNMDHNQGVARTVIEQRFREDDGDIVVSVEDQCTWLRDLGFQDVDCYMKIYAMAVFGGVKP